MGGGEAKGRAPGWLCGGAASSEIKSGVATSLCLGPGDGLMEHEFRSCLKKPGASGVALGGLVASPTRGWGGEPHFIQLLRTVLSNKDVNQAVPSLWVTPGTWFRAQSKTWVRPELLPLLSSLTAPPAQWPSCPQGCQVLKKPLP